MSSKYWDNRVCQTLFNLADIRTRGYGFHPEFGPFVRKPNVDNYNWYKHFYTDDWLLIVNEISNSFLLPI